MLDHVSIQCTDLAAASTFYDAVLATLGGTRVLDFGEAIGYGTTFPDFWIGAQRTGEGFRESHIAFSAADRAAVQAFFDVAVANGAEVLHEPRRLAGVPRALLRRLRPRSRRQQRRGRVSFATAVGSLVALTPRVPPSTS